MTLEIQRTSFSPSYLCQTRDFLGNCCRRAYDVAIPIIQVGSAYAISQLAADNKTHQSLILGGIVTGAALYQYRQWQRESRRQEAVADWVSKGLAPECAAELSQMKLTDAERSQLVDLFRRWPNDASMPAGFILGLDLFGALKSLAKSRGLEEEMEPLMLRFADRFYTHEIALSSKSDLSARERQRMIRDFSSFLAGIGKIGQQILGGQFRPVQEKIDLWITLMAQSSYVDLFMEEDRFRFSNPSEERRTLADFEMMTEFMIACFRQLKIKVSCLDPSTAYAFDADLTTKPWMKDLQRDPTRFLRSIKRSMDELPPDKISQLMNISRPVYRGAYRFRFYSQRLMGLFEDHIYGYSKKDHLARIQTNLIEVLAKRDANHGQFASFYKKFERTGFSFFARLTELKKLIGATKSKDRQLILTRLNARSIDLPYTTNKLMRELNSIYRKYSDQAKQLKGDELESLKTEYRKHAMDFAQLYLLVADIERIQKDEFSTDPLESLTDRLLEQLTLENDSMEDVASADEPELETERKESDSWESDQTNYSYDETRPEPGVKIKTRGAGYAQADAGDAPAEPASQVEEREQAGMPAPIRVRNLKQRKLIKIMKDKGFFPRTDRRGGGSHRTYADAEGRQVTIAGHGGGSVYRRGTAAAIVRALNSASK